MIGPLSFIYFDLRYLLCMYSDEIQQGSTLMKLGTQACEPTQRFSSKTCDDVMYHVMHADTICRYMYCM